MRRTVQKVDPHSPVSHVTETFDDVEEFLAVLSASPSTDPDRWFDRVEGGCRKLLGLLEGEPIVRRPDAPSGSLEEYAFEIGVRLRQTREAIARGDARRVAHGMQGVVDLSLQAEIEHGFGRALIGSRKGGRAKAKAAEQWKDAARLIWERLPRDPSQIEKARRIRADLSKSQTLRRVPGLRTLRAYVAELESGN